MPRSPDHARNVTPGVSWKDAARATEKLATAGFSWEEFSGRGDPNQAWRIYKVCDGGKPELVATTGSPEGVGVTLCTLGEEGEFDDCAVGVMQMVEGKETGTWRIKPWCASPREVSAAAKVLRSARK